MLQEAREITVARVEGSSINTVAKAIMSEVEKAHPELASMVSSRSAVYGVTTHQNIRFGDRETLKRREEGDFGIVLFVPLGSKHVVIRATRDTSGCLGLNNIAQ